MNLLTLLNQHSQHLRRYNQQIDEIPLKLQKANREKKALKLTNKKLKEIATLANIDFNLTTYVARHSYATVLKRSGATTSAIRESMGHDSEKTTQIYLDSFENIYLDEINKAIL